MKKLTNIILLALVAVGLVAVAMWLFGGDVNGDNANVSPMLIVAACMLAVAVGLLVVMTVLNMGKTRNNSRIGLYVFGGMIVAAVVIWFVWAKAVTVVGADGTVFDNVFTLKATDTALYLTYAALAFTVVSLLWGVVRKALK